MTFKKNSAPTNGPHAKELEPTYGSQGKIGTCKWLSREKMELANGSQENVLAHKWQIRKNWNLDSHDGRMTETNGPQWHAN